LTDPFPQEIETHDGKKDSQPGGDSKPGRNAEIGISTLQHAAPGRIWRRNAEPQKAHARLGKNGAGNGQRGLDQDEMDHVREDMDEHDP